MHLARSVLMIAPLAVGLACGSDPAPQEWDAFVNEFLEASYTVDPAFAVRLGRHDFDGRLADFGDAALRREIARLHAARQHALGIDSMRLDAARRFDRVYLMAVIDGQLFWLETAEWPWKNPQFYSDALDPAPYVTRDYAPLPTRLKAMIGWARAVPTVVSQVRANLRTPLPQIGRAHV